MRWTDNYRVGQCVEVAIVYLDLDAKPLNWKRRWHAGIIRKFAKGSRSLTVDIVEGGAVVVLRKDEIRPARPVDVTAELRRLGSALVELESHACA